MSRIATLARIGVASLDELVAHPDPVWLIQDAFRSDEEDDPADPHARVDLDRSWHALHWLLNGSAWGGDPPLAWAIHISHDFGDRVGYGRVGYLSPQQVREVAAALAGFPEDDLFRCYAPEAMESQRVYGVLRDDPPAKIAYLLRHFQALRAFYADVAARGVSVITSIE